MRSIASALAFLALALALFAQGTEEEQGPTFSPEKIEQLVAPIALYQDDLVSQILIAATYPLEVVDAARWYRDSVKLEGDALAKALKPKRWDPSVKALVNFPQVLEMMDKRLDWMQDLGNAFLAQEKDVMDAIQRLRKRAMDEGNLKSSKEIKVETEGTTIVIVSADPEVIYVPVYNPTVVYGVWRYPAYPPYYYYPPAWRPVPTPYAFGVGISIGVAWGYAWGRCDWGKANVNIDINRNINLNRNINRDKYRLEYKRAGVADGKGAWKHDVRHRSGVRYPDARTAQQYGRGPSPKAASREAYRGRTQPAPSRATQPARQPTPKRATQPTRQPTPSRATQPSRTRPAQPPRQPTGGFHNYNQRSAVQQQSARGHASRQSYAAHGGGGSRGGARGGGGGRR